MFYIYRRKVFWPSHFSFCSFRKDIDLIRSTFLLCKNGQSIEPNFRIFQAPLKLLKLYETYVNELICFIAALFAFHAFYRACQRSCKNLVNQIILALPVHYVIMNMVVHRLLKFCVFFRNRHDIILRWVFHGFQKIKQKLVRVLLPSNFYVVRYIFNVLNNILRCNRRFFAV